MSVLRIVSDALDVWLDDVSTRTDVRRKENVCRRLEADVRVTHAHANMQIASLDAQRRIIDAGANLLSTQLEAQALAFLTLPSTTAVPLLQGAVEKAQLHREWQTQRLPPGPSPSSSPPQLEPPRLEPLFSDTQVQALVAQSAARLKGMPPEQARIAFVSLEHKLREQLPANIAAEVAGKVREVWEQSRI